MGHEITTAVAENATRNGWHTAPECRERAESWENEELKACIDFIMEDIWEQAGKGGTSARVLVKSSRPSHFYAVLKAKMEKLGFKVEPPACPRDLATDSRLWTFEW